MLLGWFLSETSAGIALEGSSKDSFNNSSQISPEIASQFFTWISVGISSSIPSEISAVVDIEIPSVFPLTCIDALPQKKFQHFF